jgi:WD40 repeat protein
MLATICLPSTPRRIGKWLSLVLVGLVAGMSRAAAPPVQIDDEVLPRYARQRLGTMRFRVQGGVAAVALSPDGKILAVADYNRLALWDATTGAARRTLLSFRNSYVNFLTFGDSGRKLIVGEDEGELRIWDTSSWRQVGQWLQKGLLTDSVSFSADGSRFAVVDSRDQNKPHQVIVRDLAGKKEVARIEVRHNRIHWAALSPDGKRLAVGGAHPLAAGEKSIEHPERHTQIWDLARGKEILQFDSETTHYTGCFSPDGRLLALGLSKEKPVLEVRDAFTGKLRWKQPIPWFAEGGAPGQQVGFSADGKRVYAVVDFGRLGIWEAATGKEVSRRGAEVVDSPGVALLADGQAFAWGQRGPVLQVWNPLTGKVVTPGGEHIDTLNALAFTPDGKTLCGLDKERRLIRWDTTTGRAVTTHNLPPQFDEWYIHRPGWQAAFAVDASELILPGIFDEPFVIDPVSDKIKKKQMPKKKGRFPEHWQISCSADGSRFAAFPAQTPPSLGTGLPPTCPAMAFVWDRSTRKAQGEKGFWFGNEKVSLTTGRMVGALSADGKRAAVATVEPSLIPTERKTELAGWDLVTRKKLIARKLPTEWVVSLAVAPDDRTVLVRGMEAKLYLYDLLTGKDLGVIDRNWKKITAAPVFSPDGRTLALASLDDNKRAAVRLIEWASRGERRSFTPRLAADVLAFSHDSKTLASGHRDTTILLWDLTGCVERPWASRPTPAGGLWTDLGSGDAAVAWRAIEALLDRPEVALALLGERLKPARKPEIDPAAVSKLIARLSSRVFAEREAASRELAEWRWEVEASLRQALTALKDVEARRRLERLLEALDRRTTEEILQTRCVEVLERIGSAQARKFLRRLAGGDPLQVLTREARTALGRLERRGT